jgi:hypothetical protein
MKIRNGFVSNSSSSSFTCTVCGDTQEGWDICLSEAEMSECVNGHVFCNDHMKNEKKEPTVEELRQFCFDNFSVDDTEKREEILEMNREELEDEAESWDYGVDDEYDVPESSCPICSWLELFPDDVYLYLLQKIGITEKELSEQLEEQFKTYSEFK